MTAKAADAFRRHFDRDPVGVWSAPGRVNLIGEHTDYNGGYVLPFAIERRTWVAAAPRADGVISARSLRQGQDVGRIDIDDLRPARATNWTDYVFGVVWALRQKGFDVAGADFVIDSDVPSGAGLSSSAALECAIGLAALEIHGLATSGSELATIAQYAENHYAGVPCGLMDQMAASVCRADHALFYDVRDDRREHLPFDLDKAGLALLVVNTRASHAHANGAYAARRESCEAAARRLGVAYLRDVAPTDLDAALATLDDDVSRARVRHVVTENDRVLAAADLLRRREPRDIGPLLTASHVSLRDDFEVSCAELDATVDAALGAGALGARMTGGGFGGSAIVLVESDAAARVSDAVRTEFARRGFATPDVMTPAVADGVRRDS